MNSNKVQSSGDSSHLYTMIIKEGLEPGTSLANVIGEHMLSMNSNETIQPVSSMISNTDSERQSLNDLENIKYKTELCRNYSIYGFCPYTSRCQFAHGLEELRCRTRHPKYKTEFCRNFLSGFCKYGSRCQFLHDSNNTNETLSSNHILTTPSSIVTYPTAVATLGTYLLTNMLAHSATLNGLEESLAHQSALAALAAYATIPSKSTPMESSLKRSNFPFNCGIEMQQVSPFHLSSNLYHGVLIPQNQNNNDSQSYTNQTIDLLSENNQAQKTRTIMKRIRKSSAHI